MRDLGHEVVDLSAENPDVRPGISPRPSVWARVCFRAGYPRDFSHINRRIVEAAVQHRPEVLWIDKLVELRPGTLRQVKQVYPQTKLVWYSGDDMTARHHQSAYFRRCLPLFDVVFTEKSYNCNPEELPALGARNVVFVDNTYDVHTHFPVQVTQEDVERLGGDVGFIGTFEAPRAESMMYLAEQDVLVRIWGNGWRDWIGKHPNLQVEDRPLFGADYIKAICATKINLAFLRKGNRDLQTNRTFEIPACGGFMLGERTAEHQRLFEEGREAEYFGSDEELLRKTRAYLADDAARTRIARAGHERCRTDDYTHHGRLEYMLSRVAAA